VLERDVVSRWESVTRRTTQVNHDLEILRELAYLAWASYREDVKGQQKPKQLQKKAAQKTLKEKRAAKRDKKRPGGSSF
jgi:hypothetical protein